MDILRQVTNHLKIKQRAYHVAHIPAY